MRGPPTEPGDYAVVCDSAEQYAVTTQMRGAVADARAALARLGGDE